MKWNTLAGTAVCAAWLGGGMALAAGNVTWDGATQTHIQGVQVQDGNVGANGVAAGYVKASTVEAGHLYGNTGDINQVSADTVRANHIQGTAGGIGLLQVSSDGRSGQIGHIHWGEDGTFFGIKTVDLQTAEPTAAVNVEMLRTAVAVLQQQNEELRAEIEALKEKKG